MANTIDTIDNIAAVRSDEELTRTFSLSAYSGSGSSGIEAAYRLTVNVPSHPFGTTIVDISIATKNGYADEANVPTAGGASYREIRYKCVLILVPTVINMNERDRHGLFVIIDRIGSRCITSVF
ncbi:MAG: hypothetical protein WAM14_17545 [Candidatus Nitrosopolaris sp.]